MATETKIALKHFEGAYLVETTNGYLVDNRGLIDKYEPKNATKLQEATNHFNRVVKLIKQSRYAKGGTIEVGDNVHIPSFNKSGVVVKKHKHKPRFVYIVKFVDNSTAPYIREDLEKIEEMGNGGGLDGIANNNFENKLWDNLQTRSMGFAKGTTIEGKPRKKYIVWRAKDSYSSREIIAESDTSIGANQIIAKREKKGEFEGYSSWGFDNTQDYFFHKGQYTNYDKGSKPSGGGIDLVHVYDEKGEMYGTGELVEVKGNKTVVCFDAMDTREFDSDRVKPVMENGGKIKNWEYSIGGL